MVKYLLLVLSVVCIPQSLFAQGQMEADDLMVQMCFEKANASTKREEMNDAYLSAWSSWSNCVTMYFAWQEGQDPAKVSWANGLLSLGEQHLGNGENDLAVSDTEWQNGLNDEEVGYHYYTGDEPCTYTQSYYWAWRKFMEARDHFTISKNRATQATSNYDAASVKFAECITYMENNP